LVSPLLMPDALTIYIAGPYSSTDPDRVAQNVTRVIDTALRILELGHYPFIPHLTHFVDLRAKQLGINLTWDDYITWDLQWLYRCDALLYLDSSKGADLELTKAIEFGKRIFRSIDEIPIVQNPGRFSVTAAKAQSE